MRLWVTRRRIGALLVFALGVGVLPGLAPAAGSKGTFLLLFGTVMVTGILLVGARPVQPGVARDAETTPPLDRQLEALHQLGLSLSAPIVVEELVKTVTDAGLAITGARVGAFLYRDAFGSQRQYVSGADPESIAVVLRDDVVAFKSLACGGQPTRSYRAAPVCTRTGERLGDLFFGHPEPAFFGEPQDRLIKGVAVHAAISLDNARQRHAAQQALAAAEAANVVKDEFLATLSHELRTPLTAIVGWAHLLQQGRLSCGETTRAMNAIIQNASAQKQLIDELLDVSRLVKGKLQLELRPIDITPVVKAAIETVTPLADAKSVRIQLVQNLSEVGVMADPKRLQQVLWNLLSNAVKFTPRRGRIRVSIEPVRAGVEVAVSDTGLGIEATFLPRVFDRFTQSDSSSTRSAQGLGLGLAIARQLVELHRGDIRAESPGVGGGSTFTVTLPCTSITSVCRTSRRLDNEAERREPSIAT